MGGLSSHDVPAFVIINPISGPARRGSAGTRVRQAAGVFERLGVRAEIRLTERAGHAHDLALEAVTAGTELVIAWGGDGTINEVARALVQAPEGTTRPCTASLGIVPGGSGNGLARELGIPFDPKRAIERAVRAPCRTIDAGELGGRLFFNAAGIGLDARVAAAVATRVDHRGLLPYVAASAKDLWGYRPVSYDIDVDGDAVFMAALVVAFANSAQYGFGTRIAPEALLDDGLLDLIIVEDLRLIGNLARIPSLFTGRFDGQRGVRARKVREVRVHSELPMLFHVDGEAVNGGCDLTARVHAGVLRVHA